LNRTTVKDGGSPGAEVQLRVLKLESFQNAHGVKLKACASGREKARTRKARGDEKNMTGNGGEEREKEG